MEPHAAHGWRVGKLFPYGFLHEATVGSGHTLPVVGGSENAFRMDFCYEATVGSSHTPPMVARLENGVLWV